MNEMATTSAAAVESGAREESEPTDVIVIGSEQMPLLKSGQALGEGNESIRQVAVRIGTLLKTDNVSFLLGAGCSLGAGGVSLANIAAPIELALLDRGLKEGVSQPWLKLFYGVISSISDAGELDANARRPALVTESEKTMPIQINLERLLSRLHIWEQAMIGDKLVLSAADKHLSVDAKALRNLISELTGVLAEACRLPKSGKESALAVHRTLLKKVLMRPPNLRRMNFFTLNYDTLLEQACDSEGVVVVDGFVGSIKRVFRPESFNQDLYFPAHTTEGKVHRIDRVVQLSKLHGSVTWHRADQSWDNPYGLTADYGGAAAGDVLIYPSPLKYERSLGFPYSELFRKMAASIVQSQSVLFVSGYGFADEHVNSIILQALAVPSFTLVIIDPKPSSSFVSRLRMQRDQRVWIISGPNIGTLEGFVRCLLPDLREEEIVKQVMQTYNSMRVANTDSKPEASGDE